MPNKHDISKFYLIQKESEETSVGAALTDNEYAAFEILIDDYNELHSDSKTDYIYITEIAKDMLTRKKPHDEKLEKSYILYHGIIYYWSSEIYYLAYKMKRSAHFEYDT